MESILEKLDQARQKLPLKSLMAQSGRGPANGNWKSFTQCPYCDGKQTSGVFLGPHGDLFKCHRPGCRSGTSPDNAAWDEIGFLAFERGLDRRGATRLWLEEAGLGEEYSTPGIKPTHPESDSTRAQTTEQPFEKSSPVAATESDQPTAGEPAAANAPVTTPLNVFYDYLTLSPADRAELKAKRGLTDEMIEASGFRTNDRSNLSFLQALSPTFSQGELVQCGLWNSNEKGRKPSGQFYGFGVVGKKKKLSSEQLESGDYDALDDDDIVWGSKESGDCNPILIPYFNLNGELIGIRPHKGFARRQKPRLYLASGKRAVKRCKQAVVVEGEFKAAALQSVLGDKWAVASVPGITQVKNLDVWGDLLAWLCKLGAREVVVSFDNEEQSDSTLSTFRPLLEKRHEAEVWARVCAVRLAREGFSARVAHLPDDWRDKNGKADWDSALATLVRAGTSRAQISNLFTGVLQEAQFPAECRKAKLFGREAEQSISNRVEMRTYEPALPWGDESERRLAKRLREQATSTLVEWNGRVIALAAAYERSVGWYYELKLSEKQRAKLNAELSETDGREQMQFLQLALKGTPSLVASFQLKPRYVLIKADGTRDRLVKLKNTRGECSGLVALDANSLTALRDWRRRLAQIGNYGWEKGEGPLQALVRDINFKLARREVTQLVCYGCERPGKLWILDDCAYAEDGTLILPDSDGIFWHGGKGYTFLRDTDRTPRGEEDQCFRMKPAPRMWPDEGLICEPDKTLRLARAVPDDPLAIQELLGNLVLHLNDSYGEQEGAMLVAAPVAFFAAPELFQKYTQFPGVWITGEKGGGKTVTAQLLMALHGLPDIESGISCKSSSAVGMQIAIGQYANIPVWADEYKETDLRDSNLKSVIHSGFNREIASKWSAEGKPRTVRTNLLVTGETTCTNAATMSRFVSVVAAREKRSGTNADQVRRLAWLQQHRPFYFTIGRRVLQQRAKFAQRVMELLAEWEHASDLGQVHRGLARARPETRTVHRQAGRRLLGDVLLVPVCQSAFLPAIPLERGDQGEVADCCGKGSQNLAG